MMSDQAPEEALFIVLHIWIVLPWFYLETDIATSLSTNLQQRECAKTFAGIKRTTLPFTQCHGY